MQDILRQSLMDKEKRTLQYLYLYLYLTSLSTSTNVAAIPCPASLVKSTRIKA